jgi:O-acetylhomoserine/O-acetylserine sulfhydrylase-like pyridoxal-dependent enzyme
VDDVASFAREIRPDTKAVFVESITNPNAVVADLAGLAEVAGLRRGFCWLTRCDGGVAVEPGQW